MSKPEPALPAPSPPPSLFAGQWVAWDRSRKSIVAHGPDLETVHTAARKAGHPNAILQKVRDPHERFIGST